MTTFLIATAIFVILSIVTDQREEIEPDFNLEGWQEPIEITEVGSQITDNVVPFIRRKPKMVQLYQDFDPTEWTFDCGVTPFENSKFQNFQKSLTRRELLVIAKEKKVKGYSRLKTEELRRLVA